MRLRSSQFVFLMMLACSVQVGEAYALRLMTGRTLQAVALNEVLSATPGRMPKATPGVEIPTLILGVSERANAVERTPWSMPHPASASAAVVSFTGLLRA